MKALARLSTLTLLLTVSLTFAPATKASGCYDTFTYYYDCCLNLNGWRQQYCSGGGQTQGTLSGVFKRIAFDPICCDGTYSETWYQWNGSSWVELSGEPSPGCYC